MAKNGPITKQDAERTISETIKAFVKEGKIPENFQFKNDQKRILIELLMARKNATYLDKVREFFK